MSTGFRIQKLFSALCGIGMAIGSIHGESTEYKSKSSDTNWQLFANGKYSEAIENLKSGEVQNDKDAALLLGLAYDLGLGVERESDRAKHWLQRASRLGSHVADLALLDSSFSEQSTEAALQSTAHTYIRNQILGDYDKIEIGNLSFGSAQARSANIREAIRYNRTSALRDKKPEAFWNSYSLLEDPANQEVQNFFRLSQHYAAKAHELESPAALDFLAMKYRYGIGVPKDRAKAIELYRKASEKGRLESSIALGKILAKSNDPSEVAQGLDLIETFAVENAEEMQDLAEIYEDGENVEKNAAKAKELNLLAAQIGHPHAANTAAWYLSRQSASDADKLLAPNYYQLAASRGSYWGAYNYGKNLLDTSTDEQSAALGLRWLEHSARLENRSATRTLYSVYEKGQTFVPINETRSTHWLDWAIAQEDTESIELSIQQLLNTDPITNEDRAWKLSRRALALGVQDGLIVLASILLNKNSNYYNQQLAIQLLDTYGRKNPDILANTYFSLIRKDEGEEAAWAIAQLPSFKIPSFVAFHQLMYPNRSDDTLLERVHESANILLPGKASNKLLEANSLDDVYKAIAQSHITNEFNAKALAPYTIKGRSMVSGARLEIGNSLFFAYRQSLVANLKIVIDSKGNPAELEVIDSSHPLAKALAIEFGKLLRWEQADSIDAAPIQIRFPLHFREY